MQIKELKHDDSNVLLALEGELTIRYVARLKEELLLYARKYRGVALDLSAVQEIDSAGFQLLLLLKKYLSEKGAKLRLINHSLPVLKLFDLYGAIGIFGDKIKVPTEDRKYLQLSYGINRESRFGN